MFSKIKNVSLIACIALVMLFSAEIAYADQAAWVSKAEAQRALKILAEYDTVTHYCAPCKDGKVAQERIENIGLFKVQGENYWEIRINGKGVDLAYIYFPKKQNKWVNVAMTAKIDVSDVPKELSKDLLANVN